MPDYVKLNGVNQRGVCASAKEGGIPVIDYCRPSDDTILRLIDRERDYSVCPSEYAVWGAAMNKGGECNYWYNETWQPVRGGASSPFYGLCTQYVNCFEGDGSSPTLLACIECADEDDALVGVSPDMSSLKVKGQHMCFDHLELDYFKTCDPKEKFKGRVGEERQGAKRCAERACLRNAGAQYQYFRT